jgi:hypothetical protein
MKRALLILLSVVLAVPVRADWQASVQTNPPANTVFVQAVATVDQSTASFCVYAAATITAVLRVQHRNAANDTTLKEQYLVANNGSGSEFCNAVDLLASERVRVVNNALVTGTVSVSMKSSIY